MSRLDIKTPSRAQTVVEGLYRDVERRIAASPPGLCPVEMSLSFLQLCHAQTCGKCVPCRIGLGQLTKLISQVLDGTANMGTVRIIEKTARSIVDTADCAIGRDAARLVVDGRRASGTIMRSMCSTTGAWQAFRIPCPAWRCVPPEWIFRAIWPWWGRDAMPTPCA